MNNLINVKNICKEYPGFSLKNVSFHVPGGCIVGLIGENGAGKSTTIKAILDMIHLDGGSITVLGKDSHKEGDYIRENLGTVIDGASFHESLTPEQIRKFMCKIYKTWDDPYYISLLKRFSLPVHKKIGDFSTGMKMKLLISTAIAHHPKLLILDEPFVGLDPQAAVVLKNKMREICEKGGAIFFSTHVLDVAEKLCNKVAIIKDGELIKTGDMEDIVKDGISLEDIFMEVVCDE